MIRERFVSVLFKGLLSTNQGVQSQESSTNKIKYSKCEFSLNKSSGAIYLVISKISTIYIHHDENLPRKNTTCIQLILVSIIYHKLLRKNMVILR